MKTYIVKNNKGEYYEQDPYGWSWTYQKELAHRFTSKEVAADCADYFNLTKDNIEEL